MTDAVHLQELAPSHRRFHVRAQASLGRYHTEPDWVLGLFAFHCAQPVVEAILCAKHDLHSARRRRAVEARADAVEINGERVDGTWDVAGPCVHRPIALQGAGYSVALS